MIMREQRKINAFLLLFLLAIIQGTYAQEYTLPEYTSFKLDNGLTVNLMEQHEVPLISVAALIPAGAVNDGALPGLASLTATALKHGTAGFDKETIDNTLDYLGAGVNTYAGTEYAGLSANFAAADLNTVMPVIAELLQKPTFNAEEFNKEKERHLAGISRKKEQPRAVIGEFFNLMMYPEHPYSNITDGTLHSVTQIDTDALREFFMNHYRPDGSVLSIVGDFDTEIMRNMVTEYFSSWQSREGKTSGVIPELPKMQKGDQVLLVNKDDATETTFYIGGKGISRNHPDYLDIMVINTLFGGRFTSMLNDELRVNSGLTYGARSSFDTKKKGGDFSIRTFTATETTEAAIDKALEVLNKLHETGISEKDLTSAKNYVKGQFPPQYETSGQLAGLLNEMFWYDLDADFINSFNSNVDGMDMKQAKATISKYFPKKDLKIIMIGKAEAIREIAGKYGNVKEIEINSIIE